MTATTRINHLRDLQAASQPVLDRIDSIIRECAAELRIPVWLGLTASGMKTGPVTEFRHRAARRLRDGICREHRTGRFVLAEDTDVGRKEPMSWPLISCVLNLKDHVTVMRGGKRILVGLLQETAA